MAATALTDRSNRREKACKTEESIYAVTIGTASIANNAVKGTRRPLAVLKFCFYQGSAASFKLSERRAPYRNVRHRNTRMDEQLKTGRRKWGVSRIAPYVWAQYAIAIAPCKLPLHRIKKFCVGFKVFKLTNQKF